MLAANVAVRVAFFVFAGGERVARGALEEISYFLEVFLGDGIGFEGVF